MIMKKIRLSCVAIKAVICVLGIIGGLGQRLYCQNYLTSTGMPPFSAPEPVELGFADTANGNLHLVIPLGSYPQRGSSKPEDVNLIYDSNVWTIHSDALSSTWQPGSGWQLTQQIQSRQTPAGGISGCRDDVTWQDRNGTVHAFPMPTTGAQGCPSSGSAYAADSSGFWMTSSYPTPGLAGNTAVYAPDGTLVYTWPPAQDSSGKYIIGEDANGNYLSSGSNNTAFTDTLGRTIVNSGSGTSIVVSTSQGSATYQTNYTWVPVNTNFQQSGISECLAIYSCETQVLRSLTLPDQTTYYFTYDCDSSTGNAACSSPHSQTYFYGELTSVTLATGAIINYTYTMFTDAYGTKTRWLNSRTTGCCDYAYYTPTVLSTCSSSQVGCTQQTTVQRPTGSTVYTFTLNNGAWTTTIMSKDSGGRTLSTINNTWDFSQACVLLNCHGASYIRLLTQTTTLNVPSGAITSKKTYAYDTPQEGNATAVKEWTFYPGTAPTFPSVPDRATYVSYYSAGHIINKPQKTTSCSNTGTDSDCPGGGSKVSQTIVTYDSYGGSLTVVTGAANHDDANFGTTTTIRGNPTQIQEWVSGTTTYLTSSRQYDTTGQVLKIVDPAGNQTLYSYGDAFFTDNGASPPAPYTPSPKTNAYVSQITLPGNLVLSRGYYFGSGHAAVETDQNGAKTYHHFIDGRDRQTLTTWPATNGTAGAVGGNAVTYPSATEADVFAPVADASPSSACTSCRQTQFLYDGYGRKTRQAFANAPGGAINVDTVYDGIGRIQSASHPYVNTSDPTHVFETFGYDQASRRISTTHPDGQTVRSAYGLDVSAIGGSTVQTSTSYGYGYPIVSEDETSKQRQRWMDAFGRIIEVDEPSTNTATPGRASVTINFNSAQVSVTVNPCLPYSSCPRTVYNQGYVYLTVQGFTASSNYYAQVTTAQGVASDLASQLNGSGLVSASASGSTITLTALGVGTSTNYSFTSSSTYDTTDFSGPTFYTSGGTLSGGSGGVSSSPFSTFYTYDAAGNLTKVVQGVQTRTFAYDGVGRPTSINTPEAGTDTLRYDSDSNCPIPNNFPGHLVSKLDARGIRTCFQYDTLGRITVKNYSNGQGSVTYTYDQGGAAAFALGRLTSVTDPSGSETYTYDTQGAGRITRMNKVIGTTTYTIGYQYNTAGQITQVTYPSGRAIQQNLDAVGRLSSIVDSLGGVNTTRASSYAYNNSQQVTGFSYGNGVNASFSFSPQRDEMTGLSYAKGTQTLFSLSYLYQNDPTNCPGGTTGNSGQIDCINDGVDSGRSVAYTYDALGRALTALTHGSSSYPQWGLSWNYDRYGNRLNQTITAGSGYSNSLSFGNPGGAQTNHPDGMCFDSSGNMTAESGTCPPTSPMYSYDAENRMTAYSGSSAASYVYDDNGNRVKKCLPNCTSPTTTTVYVFSAGSDIAEYDNGAVPASPSREYIYSGGRLITTLAGSTTTYHHADHLSVRLSTNTNGNKVGEQGHYPYGESWYTANTTTKFVFTGYQRDSESNNDYAMARYYRVGFGRFCSPDPLMGSLGDPQSWNRYLYARDNPISNIDPSGMGWLSSFFKALVNFFTGVAFPSAPPTIVPTFPSPGSGQSVWDKLADAITPPMMAGGTPPFLGWMASGVDATGAGAGSGTNWTDLLEQAADLLNFAPCSDFVDKAFKAVGSTATAGDLQQLLPKTPIDPDLYKNDDDPGVAGIAATTGGSNTVYIGPAWSRASDQPAVLVGEGMHLKKLGTDQGAVSDTTYADKLQIPYTPDKDPSFTPEENREHAASRAFHGELEKHCRSAKQSQKQ